MEEHAILFETYSRHYIKVDEFGRIMDSWSDGPLPEKDLANAICINEQGSYQFRLFANGEENPSLYTIDGIPLYKWDGQKVKERTYGEIDEDRENVSKRSPTREDDLVEMAIDHELRITMLELGL